MDAGAFRGDPNVPDRSVRRPVGSKQEEYLSAIISENEDNKTRLPGGRESSSPPSRCTRGLN